MPRSRAWTKAEVTKVEAQLLALGLGHTKRVWQRAELGSTRTLAEVQKLQEALKLLIYRCGNIKKAKNGRAAKAFHKMMDLDQDIPTEVIPFCANGVEAGFYKYYAFKDREAHEQLSPRSRGLAVWADAELITDEIKEQLPTSTHRALLADSTLRHLKDDGSRIMKQLEERTALAELLAAVDSDDPAAKSRLSSLTQLSYMHNPPNPCQWWGPKDNEMLLREYHKRGVYLHRKNRELVRLFAEGLLQDSQSCVHFSVMIKYDVNTYGDYDLTTNGSHGAGKPKRTVVWGETQWEDGKEFLITQLTLLMEGVLNPAKVQEKLARENHLEECRQRYREEKAARLAQEAGGSAAAQDVAEGSEEDHNAGGHNTDGHNAGGHNAGGHNAGGHNAGGHNAVNNNGHNDANDDSIKGSSSNADQNAEGEPHTQAGSRASVQTKRRQQPSSPLANKKARADADAPSSRSHDVPISGHTTQMGPLRRPDTNAHDRVATEDQSAARAHNGDSSACKQGRSAQLGIAAKQDKGAVNAAPPNMGMPRPHHQKGGVMPAAMPKQSQQPSAPAISPHCQQPSANAMPQPSANAMPQQCQQPPVPSMPQHCQQPNAPAVSQQHPQSSGGTMSRPVMPPQAAADTLVVASDRCFTRETINVLRHQIIALRCIQKGHSKLPPALMRAIKPPSVHAQAALPVTTASASTCTKAAQSLTPAMLPAHPAATQSVPSSAAQVPPTAAAAPVQMPLPLLTQKSVQPHSVLSAPQTDACSQERVAGQSQQQQQQRQPLLQVGLQQQASSLMQPCGQTAVSAVVDHDPKGDVNDYSRRFKQQHQQMTSLLQRHQLAAAVAAAQQQQQTLEALNRRLQWETSTFNMQQNLIKAYLQPQHLIKAYLQPQQGHTQQHCCAAEHTVGHSIGAHKTGDSGFTQGSMAAGNKENV